MVFKITFVLFIKLWSYCTSKEFAFKDQKSKKMERKASVLTKDWIPGSFFTSSLQARAARAQPSRPVIQVNDGGVGRIKECGGRDGRRRKGNVDIANPKARSAFTFAWPLFHFYATFS